MKQTTNYSLFKVKQGNRVINQKHVEKLKDSFQKHDYLPSCPIIVDEDFNVIDGQHRLEAAKQLGIAVYYVTEKEPDNDLLIDLNITQRKWTSPDYVNYYAEKGNEHYIRFRQLLKDIPLDVNTLLDMAKNTDIGGSYLTNVLKTGLMKIEKTEVIRAHQTYEKVLTLRDALRIKLTGRMVKAVIKLQHNPKFSWSIMLNKAKQFYVKSYPCTTKQEWMDMLTMVYNYSSTKATRL